MDLLHTHETMPGSLGLEAALALTGPAEPQPHDPGDARGRRERKRRATEPTVPDAVLDVALAPTRTGMLGIPGRSLEAGVAALPMLERRAAKPSGLDVERESGAGDDDHTRARPQAVRLRGGARGPNFRDTAQSVVSRAQPFVLAPRTITPPETWVRPDAPMRAVPDYDRPEPRLRGLDRKRSLHF